jgi:hypothetical protein
MQYWCLRLDKSPGMARSIRDVSTIAASVGHIVGSYPAIPVSITGVATILTEQLCRESWNMVDKDAY